MTHVPATRDPTTSARTEIDGPVPTLVLVEIPKLTATHARQTRVAMVVLLAHALEVTSDTQPKTGTVAPVRRVMVTTVLPTPGVPRDPRATNEDRNALVTRDLGDEPPLDPTVVTRVRRVKPAATPTDGPAPHRGQHDPALTIGHARHRAVVQHHGFRANSPPKK